MDIQKVLITGSEGLIGRVVVQDLRQHGYQVTPVDRYAAQKWGTKTVDCEDFGQVVSVMREHQAVIHLAAIPNPLRNPTEVVFRNNVISTYNILEAAAVLGIKNVVLASSISALGTAYMLRNFSPHYIPIDEAHPLLAQDAYGLSKMVGEELAEGFSRRIPDMSLTSLRFTMVADDAVRSRYARSSENQAHLNDHFAGVFWTYIDVRDTAAACRMAMEANIAGHQAFYIAAPDIMVDTPVEALLAKYFPGKYPLAAQIHGSTSPIDTRKARRMLGWKAVYNWDGKDL